LQILDHALFHLLKLANPHLIGFFDAGVFDSFLLVGLRNGCVVGLLAVRCFGLGLATPC